MVAREKHPGVIFVIIGPGGAGKNAIMKAILDQFDMIQQLATVTTREMRCDEKQGREHQFLSLAEFERMVKYDELLEFQEVTPGKFYGIPRAIVASALAAGAARIADIDVLGARILAQRFQDNVVQIFVTVPGAEISQQLDLLRKRMLERADQNTDIEERLERARLLELPYQVECDYVVVNDELARAIGCIGEIVQSELIARGLLGGPE